MKIFTILVFSLVLSACGTSHNSNNDAESASIRQFDGLSLGSSFSGSGTAAPAVLCQQPVCPAPPAGCSYGKTSVGLNGCQIGCGSLSCPNHCLPPPLCPAPPPGCSYGKPSVDSNGCQIGCGSLLCPNHCLPPPLCPAPPPGCTFGKSPVDANGCTIGCGKINCVPQTPGGSPIK